MLDSCGRVNREEACFCDADNLGQATQAQPFQ
jgi:hypothetical protein